MIVKFYLSPRIDKKGESPIRVSIATRGTRLVSTVGKSIKPSMWNKESQKARSKAINAKGETGVDINAELDRIKSRFSTYETTLKHKPSQDELADILAEQKGCKRRRTAKEESEDSTPKILKCFDLFVKEGKSGEKPWTAGTLQCWAAFRKHLSRMGDVDFSFFDKQGMTKFVNYLRNEDESIGKSIMDERTVKKHFSNLRWFLFWCIDNNYCKPEQIYTGKYRFDIPKKEAVYLKREELLKLFHYEIPENGAKVELHDMNGKAYTKTVHDAAALSKTRDIFCFCAFTSLRYSDADRLKKLDVHGDVIIINSKKDNDRLTIQLTSYSKAILDKYKDVEIEGGKALPKITNQKMNEYIKDLGELCEFNDRVSMNHRRGGVVEEDCRPKWQYIGTHTARRTFISNAIHMGIPPQTIMEWTGHSSYSTMEKYIGGDENAKKENMKRFEENMKSLEDNLNK